MISLTSRLESNREEEDIHLKVTKYPRAARSQAGSRLRRRCGARRMTHHQEWGETYQNGGALSSLPRLSGATYQEWGGTFPEWGVTVQRAGARWQGAAPPLSRAWSDTRHETLELCFLHKVSDYVCFTVKICLAVGAVSRHFGPVFCGPTQQYTSREQLSRSRSRSRALSLFPSLFPSLSLSLSLSLPLFLSRVGVGACIYLASQ